MRIQSINPATERINNEFESHSTEQVNVILEKSRSAFKEWRFSAFEDRTALLLKLAENLQNEENTLSRLITAEMGKAIKESRAEIDKCIWLCRYYADHGMEFLEAEEVDTGASKSFVTFQPLGTVLSIMPWNFPFWQVFRCAVPALMAGNSVILKHSSNVPGCALAIESLFIKSGFPDYIFQNLFLGNDETTALIESETISAVALTGSNKAGSIVAAKAGGYIKKSVLELGGSDAYVILNDADIEHAAIECTKSRLQNAGQSCIAAKRFIVEADVYDKFIEAMHHEMESKVMGDPMLEETDIGPQAREDLRNKLHKQVQMSLIEGARDVLGCKIPTMDGFYYPPSILADVKPGMPVFDDEIFGPVAAICKAKDEGEAIELANKSIYGLGAAIFTSDIEKGEKIAAEKLEAGSCFVNQMVNSDPRMPFGGIKQSGYGRELSSYGIREFVNIKSVSIK